ncbi:MAG: hypothetical protein ACTSR8_03625 [Promethearchaeota archaeon]
MILEQFNNAVRTFQYDYIYIDAICLTIWVSYLIYTKKWAALKAGIFFGMCVYFIDAIWWWNTPAGANYPEGTYIREYIIGGVELPHPLGKYFWLKFGADFMMTISYGMFAFAWFWIIFENFSEPDKKEIVISTCLYFGSWLIIPFISLLLPIDDRLVETVRHMDTQMFIWIVNVIVGYFVLSIIYGTDKFNSKNPKIICYVFIIGCLQSFFMEFPLFISGIRPTRILFLIYEIFFLVNQGAPYLYILWDKILPKLARK